MQLGTRWQAGGTPPKSVPADLLEAISRVEATLPQAASLNAGAPMPMWTLTWLEGRPVVELDSGIELSVDAEGAITASRFDPMD
ncbi:hypothetical protein [Microbacterium amylolyticum]|uniref:Fe-S oxidoreductase n=1 Tax=Microbacterium amylolyticum TaxID=936337 RepID=A0ABS4ZGV1_9MICO|nr:hypothetical protein [Microbacterium amylolyticum]MBP2435706.1 hypothetical protein [Microbacterium amylolyticum]